MKLHKNIYFKPKNIHFKAINVKVGGVGGCAQFIFFQNLNKPHFFVWLANINKQFVHHLEIN